MRPVLHSNNNGSSYPVIACLFSIILSCLHRARYTFLPLELSQAYMKCHKADCLLVAPSFVRRPLYTIPLNTSCFSRVSNINTRHHVDLFLSRSLKLQRSSMMSGSAAFVITTVLSMLAIVDIVGNSLVCLLIKRNRDMRYAETTS